MPVATFSSAANSPQARDMIVKEQQKEFMPHIAYFGDLDDALGISHFWSDKLIAALLYLQRYAIILMWNVGWPQLYRTYSRFYYGFLLDFSAHPNGKASLGEGTALQGCGTVCRVVWPLVCVPILLLWAAVGLLSTSPLYYTRNIERILWSVVRVGLLPFTSMLIRYYILNQEGNLDQLGSAWSTPTSELGVVFLVLTVGLFVYLGIARSQRQVLFRSSVRHEAYLKTRELEYRLRLSPNYRNERLWMISSYVYQAWFWSVARGVVDVGLLFIINFAPPQTGVVIADAVLFLYFMYGFVFDIYRCRSTNHMEHVYNCTLFIYCILATIQGYGVTSTWLVDTQIDYFMLAVGLGALAVTFAMALYYFVDSHRILGLTVAERRSNKKWKRIFGTEGGKYVQLERVDLRTLSAAELEDSSKALGSMRSSSFRRTSTLGDSGVYREDSFVDDYDQGRPQYGDAESPNSASASGVNNNGDVRRRKKSKHLVVAVRMKNSGNDGFYVPRSGGFLSIDNSSDHVWPVNDGIVNELLRMNQDNHLIDMLRAARSMVDRISSLHNTAILVPIDELKTHIFRLRQCVEYCKRYRVTHHCNLIHPLQYTFEDLIEQFTYELRIFAGVSITFGNNAKKMNKVSRDLRVKQVQRDHTLALVSPLMRRVLIKLLALRLFVQLLDRRDRRTLLGFPVNDDDFVDDFGRVGKIHLPGDDEGSSSSTDSDEQRRHLQKKKQEQTAGKKPKDEAVAKDDDDNDDPFADAEDIDPFADPVDDKEAGSGELGAQNLFGDLPRVDDDEDQVRESELAALLAKEAAKLIRRREE